MADILLVDPSETARRALAGLLARGDHGLAVVDRAAAAVDFVQRHPGIDLVITELSLRGEDGLTLVRLLKADPILRYLPVVVYAGAADREMVRRALDLRVQNFLIKPYREDALFAEIAKAEANPWRARHFEEPRSFCQLTGIPPAGLRRMLAEVRDGVERERPVLGAAAKRQDLLALTAGAAPLRLGAEAAGAWGVVEAIGPLVEHATAGNWILLETDLRRLACAQALLAHWLEPRSLAALEAVGTGPADGIWTEERRRWAAADERGAVPVETPERLLAEIEALPGCPVVDSAAAAFQMVANGHPDCINPLMDLVARDPGLTVQMLVAANRAHPPAEDFNRIEDARLAIGQLGELRLLDEARRLVQVDERVFDLGGGFAWPRFWAFQRGVARIAQHICRELEFDSLEPAARTAGQIHDLGLLLLARVRPGGFQALLAAQRRGETHPRAVERRLLGCTTPELAARFAETHGLSPRFVRVLRGRDDPAAAGEDRHLAAIVSLARHLCRHNRVGDPGEPPPGQAAPLEETPEWAVLREGLYPSFNFRRFELRIHAQCTQLESDLRGRDAGTVAETVAGAET